MDEIKKISYKPEIKYTDEYKSDIILNKDTSITDTNTDNNETSEIEDLLEQGSDIQNMIDKLPDDLSDILKDPFDPIIDFIENELKDKELEKVPVELDWKYPTIKPSETVDPTDPNIPPYDDPDWDNIWDDDDFIPIDKTVYTKEEIIQKEYVKNLYDLFTNYFEHLNRIISNYWTVILVSVMNKETDEIKTIMDNILLSSNQIKDDKKHLLDMAIRSQIHKDMKLKYFSNNFNAEDSMKHLKQFKSTYELRLRYSKIEKNNNPSTKSEQMSNNILEGMNLSYNLKYDKAYENLYRYLKSSNVILEDSLNSSAQSIKAKQALIDTKGVK